MKHDKLFRIGSALLLAGLLAGSGIPVTAAGSGNSSPGILPPHSNAYGKSLADWLTTYCAWSYGYGPADGMAGQVMLMPMPSSTQPSGQGTVADPLVFVGHADLTIPSGTPFVLPVVEWLGEAYANGARDPAFPADWLGRYYGADVTLDGRPVLTPLQSYYVGPINFDPPLIYAEPTSYGSVGIAFFQGAGFVSTPLSVGVHHMTVRAWFLVPADNGIIPETGFVFENSWTLTVKPKR